jgi:hypothetical protein
MKENTNIMNSIPFVKNKEFKKGVQYNKPAITKPCV